MIVIFNTEKYSLKQGQLEYYTEHTLVFKNVFIIFLSHAQIGMCKNNMKILKITIQKPMLNTID